MATSCDLVIFRIAAGQGGVFSERQALDAGMTPRSIKIRLENGTFVRWGGRVLSLADWPRSDLRSLRAATLAVRGSAVARRSAANLLGMPAIGAPRTPAVVVPKGRTRDLPEVRVHETRLLGRAHLTTVDGLWVTNAPRTLIDLAGDLGWSRLAYVTDRCTEAGNPRLPELAAAHASITRRGRRGTARMTRYLLSRHEPPTVALSEFEWRFELLLDRRGIPRPIRQFRPPWYDGRRGIADYGSSDRLVLVELDGRSFHSTMQAFGDDRRRDRLAHRHGWTPLRYTYVEMTEREDEVVEELRHFLSRGSSVHPDRTGG